MAHPLRGATAIVGWGHSGFGEAPGRSPMEIMVEAVHNALEDSGLKLSDIDGVCSASPVYNMASVSAAEYLGIRPKFTESTMIGGSSFVSHLLPASMALHSGICDAVLVCYGSNQRTATGRLVTNSEPQIYEAPYKQRYPITAYALAAARHMHQYGTTREQLADVAVAARQWAQLNPEAFARDPLTRDDVMTDRKSVV